MMAPQAEINPPQLLMFLVAALQDPVKNSPWPSKKSCHSSILSLGLCMCLNSACQWTRKVFQTAFRSSKKQEMLVNLVQLSNSKSLKQKWWARSCNLSSRCATTWTSCATSQQVSKWASPSLSIRHSNKSVTLWSADRHSAVQWERHTGEWPQESHWIRGRMGLELAPQLWPNSTETTSMK